MALVRIVVLNDGETFTTAPGCAIYDVDDNASTDEIEEALKDLERAKQVTRGIVLTDPLVHLVAQFDGMDRMIVT